MRIYRKPILILYIFLSCSSFISCSHDSENISSKQPTIYISFTKYNRNSWDAGYWMNDSLVTMTKGSSPMIYVDDDKNIYFMGGDDCYWKNKERFKLNTIGADEVLPNSMTVSDHVVYVGGSIYSQSVNHWVESYWINGVMYAFNKQSRSQSIAVLGNYIYTAGYDSNDITGKYNAAIWTNGQESFLSSSRSSTAASVYISDKKDLYVTGCDYVSHNPKGSWNSAVYWKNGQETVLPDLIGEKYLGSASKGIFVSGNDVYVVGSILTSDIPDKYSQGYWLSLATVAALWKNGNLTLLTNESLCSDAKSVYVYNNDVYICGVIADSSYGTHAVYWKNGVQHQLDSSADESIPGNIIVK